MALHILLTGARGLLGQHLLSTFVAQGHTVQALEGDITDPAVCARYQEGFYDWVVHAAAMTRVDLCEIDKERCYAVNVEGTKNMCALSRHVGARLLYVSTVSVFSGEAGDYREYDPPYPKNFYSLTKLLAEQHVRALSDSMVLRLNLIGVHPQGSRGRNFLEWLIDSCAANRDMTLFTDVIINPLSGATAAHVITELVERAGDEAVVHIGTSTKASKAAIGSLIAAQFPEYRGVITHAPVAETELIPRAQNMWLNVARAEALLGRTMPTLETELVQAVAGYFR